MRKSKILLVIFMITVLVFPMIANANPNANENSQRNNGNNGNSNESNSRDFVNENSIDNEFVTAEDEWSYDPMAADDMWVEWEDWIADPVNQESMRDYELIAPFSATPSVFYSAHVQDIGWMATVSNGSTAGTTGRALRMEAMRVS